MKEIVLHTLSSLTTDFADVIHMQTLFPQLVCSWQNSNAALPNEMLNFLFNIQLPCPVPHLLLPIT